MNLINEIKEHVIELKEIVQGGYKVFKEEGIKGTIKYAGLAYDFLKTVHEPFESFQARQEKTRKPRMIPTGAGFLNKSNGTFERYTLLDKIPVTDAEYYTKWNDIN